MGGLQRLLLRLHQSAQSRLNLPPARRRRRGRGALRAVLPDDGVVLRYRMLRAATRCYDEKGGLQTLFGDTKKRKAAELKHVEDLANQFQALLCVNEVRAAKQTGGDSDHRSLPVHFVNV